MDSAKETPGSIAGDLFDQALRIMQAHDPRSLTAQAAAKVLAGAVGAIEPQPGEHSEDVEGLACLAETLRRLVIAAPLTAEIPARELQDLVRAARYLKTPARWQPSCEQRRRGRLTLGVSPDAVVPFHRFGQDGTYQSRLTALDEWTDIPVSVSPTAVDQGRGTP